ncbi:MAG TPA: hypothetical protein VD793_10290, partial [Gemmatimonadales bacterium]|nr:hypothetical protein [Gemmatimonadales bacterium]
MPAHFRIRRLGTIAWCLALAACEHVANPPDSTDPPELFQNGTVADASSELGEGASAFAAVTLGEDGLLARRITLSPPGEREAVVGRVTALEVSGSAGSLTLNLSGLEVLFDGETQFTAGEGEPVAAEIALARLSAALAEGGHPWVEAARPAADAPQAPGDATFRAQVIRLVGEADARQVRLNVDLDNLVRNTSPPPDGWLAVLGLRIEIRVSEGLTEIHIANHAVDRREFRGPVASVNLEERSLTLTDGTVIRAAGETEIALYRHDAAELPSLEAAAQALDAGLAVIAAGVGLVQSEEPLVLVALRLRLALHAELREFRGTVAYVDLSARRFTLEDGTVVRLFAGTVIYFGDDPVRYRSLEAVAEAVAAGITVRAAGVGAVLSEGLL